jgi:hypothetical protein
MSKPHHGFPSGYFKIRSRLTGNCVDIKGADTNRGAGIMMNKCHNGPNQQWYVDGLGRVSSKINGRTLDIAGGNKSNGAKVHMWDQHHGKNQQWYVDNVGRIITRHSKKSLSYDENKKTNPTLYMWDNYNGPSQKWYFERVGGDRTVQLLKEYKGTQGVKRIPASMITPSADVTYQFWMKLDQFQGGKWKGIFCKSKSAKETRNRAPGLWVYPNKLKFHPRATTTKNWNEGINGDVPYQIPLKKWINVAYIVRENMMDFYVNGNRVMTGEMKGHMNLNVYDLYVGSNNQHLHMKNFEHSNYALSKAQILKNMRSSDPSKNTEMDPYAKQPERMPKSGVNIERLISNGSHKSCPAYRGRLGSYAWCAKSPSREFYLEARFDQEYHVKKIMTQGRTSSNQWVTKYAVKYIDKSGVWKKYGDKFTGNDDRHTIQSNKVDFIASVVRIYPLSWHSWPSMRLGFDGLASSASKCAKYKEESINGDTPELRKASLDAYNQECRKISYYKHLRALNREKDKYEKLYNMLNASKKGATTAKQDVENIKQKMREIKQKYKKSKIDLEIAKAKKCPPAKQCLPIIDTSIAHQKKPSVNDFDIRTHQEFHKYVLAGNVKPCPGVEDLLKGKYKDLSDQLEKPEDVADACSARFNNEDKKAKTQGNSCQARFNKITDKNIVEMTGGGLYRKLCQIASDAPSAPKPKPTACIRPKVAEEEEVIPNKLDRAFEDDPYDIKKHKDFDKLMDDYVHKSNCGSSGSIRDHPEYRDLMDKFALKDNDKCPPIYVPCPTPKKEMMEQCAAMQNDITRHPGYTKLMDKYARKDDQSCPSNYLPCPTVSNAVDEDGKVSVKHLTTTKTIVEKILANGTPEQRRKLLGSLKNHPDSLVNVVDEEGEISPRHLVATSKVVERILERGTPSQRRQLLGDIKYHPDLSQYVSINKVKGMSKKMLEDAVKSGKLPPNCPQDIARHPGYKALMKKYAVLDKKTCPPTYRPCSLSNKVSTIAIEHHPDIKKYVKRTDVDKIKAELNSLTKMYVKRSEYDKLKLQYAQAIKSNNMSNNLKLAAERNRISGSDQEMRSAQETIRKQKQLIGHLQNIPIQSHPQYEELMSHYATKDNTTCPSSYKPCKQSIDDHPEIHRYILKTQIPTLVTRECGKTPIQSHPEFNKYVAKAKVGDLEKYQDIDQHPDIHNYILKSQIPGMIDKECRKHFNDKRNCQRLR